MKSLKNFKNITDKIKNKKEQALGLLEDCKNLQKEAENMLQEYFKGLGVDLADYEVEEKTLLDVLDKNQVPYETVIRNRRKVIIVDEVFVFGKQYGGKLRLED